MTIHFLVSAFEVALNGRRFSKVETTSELVTQLKNRGHILVFFELNQKSVPKWVILLLSQGITKQAHYYGKTRQSFLQTCVKTIYSRPIP